MVPDMFSIFAITVWMTAIVRSKKRVVRTLAVIASAVIVIQFVWYVCSVVCLISGIVLGYT